MFDILTQGMILLHCNWSKYEHEQNSILYGWTNG